MGSVMGGGICLAAWKLITGNRPYFPKRKGAYSVKDGASDATCWRHADYATMKDEPIPGCKTIYDVFEYAVDKNGNKPAIGERRVLKVST